MPPSTTSEVPPISTTISSSLVPMMSPLIFRQSSSKTWKSTTAKKKEVKERAQGLKIHQGSSLLRREGQKFERFQAQRAYLGLRQSPFIPQNLPEWIEHHRSYSEAELIIAKQKLLLGKTISPIGPAMGGKVFSTNHSAVLSCRTVFSPAALSEANNGAPPVEWPKDQEFKFEGNDRQASHFGRFLPLPRNIAEDECLAIYNEIFNQPSKWDGKGLVPWYLRELKVLYSMDTMRRLEDMWGERVDVDEGLAKQNGWINSDLWDMIN